MLHHEASVQKLGCCRLLISRYREGQVMVPTLWMSAFNWLFQVSFTIFLLFGFDCYFVNSKGRALTILGATH